MIKLCSCLSYFPGFFSHFESLALFSKMGRKPYTKAVKHDQTRYFSQFLKDTTVFKKNQAILTKNKDKPNSRHLPNVFQQKTVSLWKKFGLLDCFLGTKVTKLICG